MREFILGEDPDRLCFLLLVSNDEMIEIVRAIKDDPRFSTKTQKFFTFESGTFAVDGNTSVFDNWYIPRHVPSIRSNVTSANAFLSAFNLWKTSSSYLSDTPSFLATESVPTEPSEEAFFTYLSVRYFIELFRLTTQRSTVMPAPADVLAMAYTSRIFIEGMALQPLLNQCNDQPLADKGCFCNVASRITHTFKVNGSTGKIVQVVDDSFSGKAGYATTVMAADDCTPDILDDGNYPIVLSVVLPNLGDMQDMVTRELDVAVSYINNAEPRPRRPFRVYLASSDNITNDFQLQVHRRVQPFITALSMGDQLTQSPALVIFPNADTQLLEDPPLKHYTYGDENMLNTLTTNADNMYALVAYYAANAGLYTGISAYAPSAAEAALLQKTLYTFQINVQVIVDSDPQNWQSVIEYLSSQTSNPFVIVSAWSNEAMVSAAIEARHRSTNGIVAVATFEGNFMEFSNYTTVVGDIFFVSLLSEWWMDYALISSGGDDPTAFLPALTIAFSYLVAQQATAASISAATVLYQLGSLSVSGVTFGPYSNATCTDQQIATNDRARICQCYKGPRLFNVHSLKNLNEKTLSNRTGRFSYPLGTCGVVYSPLIDNSEAALSGVELGVVIAAVVVFMIIFIAAAMIFVCCFYGKKNWHAPMDSTKPFAMVFTDIQNSTGLWARAPAAMSASVSQHHALIRTLVKKYNGYEVKTIGDSFMVAFKNANNAALLALEIQSLFYNSQWPSEIDAIYTELISEAAAADAKLSVALGADPEQYKRLWNGVRVRVGVHYGFGNITKDPVSLGYDYYGTVVNTAARVEGVGHGGQVLLTDDAFQALDPAFVEKNTVQVIDLGLQPLRGLDDQVKLRQLTPMLFHERSYPPLRLDVERDITAADQSGSDPTGSDTTEEITPELMAARIANMPNAKVDADTIMANYNFFITGFSAATDHKWRKDTIKALGKSWNIDIRNTPNEMMRGLMLMSVKIEMAKAKAAGRRPSRFSASMNNKTSVANRSITTRNDLAIQPSDVYTFSAPTSPAAFIARNHELTNFDTPL
eukprot:GILI01005006.1.p1 GENE.GILI01005006.1~~GILI01005006.1.p1  ORF type:complete len:1071 (+),score=200.31 GILI01005006.1:88-3213(+)